MMNLRLRSTAARIASAEDTIFRWEEKKGNPFPEETGRISRGRFLLREQPRREVARGIREERREEIYGI